MNSIGPFDLEKRIGKGGMGEVWSGRHRSDGVEIAVKVLTQVGTRRAEYIDAFRNEVRGLAGFNHPGIVTVYDYGEISEETARASGGAFHKGSPYLVMELGKGGSLLEHVASIQWRELQVVLFALLDALGYAHAAGVIHRDLKPANVLVGCGADRRQIKLTDFGLAHAFDRHEFGGLTDTGWGTPQFMAPEQFRAAWRDYGPWTDLYGLGVMTHVLCNGNYPYHATSYSGWSRAHQLGDVPPLEPRFPVPAGFEEWLHRLLARDPAHRFQFAADAAWALYRLGDPGVTTTTFTTIPLPRVLELAWGERKSEQRTRTVDDKTVVDAPPVTMLLPTIEKHGPATEPTEPPAQAFSRDLPPVPATWDRLAYGQPRAQMSGVGLGLFGVRLARMSAREEERDLLWQQLREVHQTSTARAIVIRGSGGTGKSRLAKWLTRRAHEVGGARVLKVVYSPISGPGDGLARMVAQHLRAGGLNTEATIQRVGLVMQRYGVRDSNEVGHMARFVLPLAATSPEIRALSVDRPQPNARYHTLYNYMRRIGEDRPLVVWFDDVQWGADALAFMQFVLERQHHSQLPVLFVATARDETLVERPIETRLLGEIAQNRRTTLVDLKPLTENELTRVMDELLGLSPTLNEHVLRVAAGNPLIAVQTIGDWVAGGRLIATPDGFELKDPASIDAQGGDLWRERLAMLLRRRPVEDQIALEIAAALGTTVDLEEWTTACAKYGVSLHPALVRDLLESGLMLQSSFELSFCHGVFRERVEQMSDEEGRQLPINLACIAMLERLYPERQFPFFERKAQHLLHAGMLAEAVEPLLHAAAARVDRSEFDHALELLQRRDSIVAVAMSGQPLMHAQLQGALVRASIDLWRRRLASAAALAQEISTTSRREGWFELVGPALLLGGLALLQQSRLDRAEQALQHARQIFVNAGDVISEARSLLALGRVQHGRGRYDNAETAYRSSRQAFVDAGHHLGEAECENALGDLARDRSDWAEALRHAQRALQLFELCHNAIGIADCVNDIAELHRLRGDYEAARLRCIDALRRYEALGSVHAFDVQINLALTLRALGDSAQARQLLENARTRAESASLHAVTARANLLLLPALLKLGETEVAWARFEASRERAAEHALVGRDVAGAVAVAAAAFRRTGQHERADTLEHFAIKHLT